MMTRGPFMRSIGGSKKPRVVIEFAGTLEEQQEDCRQFAHLYMGENLLRGSRDLLAAAKERIAKGHNDTCGAVISSMPYPCSCGHDTLAAAVAKAEGK